MRKINKILFISFLVLTLLIGVNKVNAVSKNDKLTFGFYHGNLNSNLSAGLYANGSYYQAYNYYGTFTTGSNKGQQVKLYCIDPQRLNNRRGTRVSVTQVVDFNSECELRDDVQV